MTQPRQMPSRRCSKLRTPPDVSDESADPDGQELIAQLRAQLQSPSGASQHGGSTTDAAGDGVNRAETGLGERGLESLGADGLQAPREFPTVSLDALEIADALLGTAPQAADAPQSPSAASRSGRPADDA